MVMTVAALPMTTIFLSVWSKSIRRPELWMGHLALEVVDAWNACGGWLVIVKKARAQHQPLGDVGVWLSVIGHLNRPSLGIRGPVRAHHLMPELQLLVQAVGRHALVELRQDLVIIAKKACSGGECQANPNVYLSESERTPGYLKRSQVPPMLPPASSIVWLRCGTLVCRRYAVLIPARPALRMRMSWAIVSGAGRVQLALRSFGRSLAVDALSLRDKQSG